ncbi:MAG TPA: cysteine synthase family protein [Terriglobales bacterium]|nr:cysteine synthase family protein [Terriglobales bacterium]
MPRVTAAKIERGALGDTLLDRIGNTPLLRMERISGVLGGAQVLGKAEWHNPGGSVKDRAAAHIVRDAQRSGALRGRTLLDSTSGNTGIAYAMLGAALGFPVALCVPSNVSEERKRILNAYGARVIWTDAGEGSDGAIRKAQELSEGSPDRYLYVDQYSNAANWRAHYEGTANEIWRETYGRITHFVATLGTSGTFMGTARRLKELDPGIKCISLQPDSPFHGLEGMKHMPTAIVPKIYDPALADRNLEISTEAAHAMVRRVACEEGVLLGVSAGAALVGCLEVAAQLTPAQKKSAVIVTIFPDSGEKYLSERFWQE